MLRYSPRNVPNRHPNQHRVGHPLATRRMDASLNRNRRFLATEGQKADPAKSIVTSTPQESGFAKVRKIMKQYLDGTKELYRNTREMQRLNKLPLTSIKRKEWELITRTRGDLAKGIPFVTLFALPIVGYTAPILAIAFPSVLPDTFLSPAQRDAQMGVNLERRKQAIPQLQVAVNHHMTKRLGGSADLQQSLTEYGPRWTFGELDTKHLRSLHNYFLMKNPTVVSFLPKFMLKRALTTRAFNLMEADRILKSDGVSDMTPQEVKTELVNRGLDVWGTPDSDNKRKLEVWASSSQLHLDPSQYLHRLYAKSDNYVPFK